MKPRHQKSSQPKTAGAPRAGKKKRRYSLPVRLFSVLLSLVMCLVASGLLYLGITLYRINTSGEEIPPEDVPTWEEIPEDELGPAPVISNITPRGSNREVTNILLIGVDTRQKGSFSGLSDTMILLSINKRHKEIRLISFLRDTYVQIPAHGKYKERNGKLNSAFSAGGFELLAKTFERNFALQLDKYVVVNFSGLEQIVDAVGGLDIQVTAAEAGQIPVSKNSSRKLGGGARTVHLNGYQTVQYARIRKIDSDFNRTLRQQKVLRLLFDKVKSSGPVAAHNFVYTALDYVKTNLTEAEIVGYAINGFTTYSQYALKTDYQVPSQDEYIGKTLSSAGAVLILKDPNETVLKLHRYLYE